MTRATTEEPPDNCAASMALSADAHYLDWLQGHQLNDRDRGTGYTRIKDIWGATAEQTRPLSMSGELAVALPMVSTSDEDHATAVNKVG